MVFDKISVNSHVIEAEGQYTQEERAVRLTTPSGSIGQYFNQLESTGEKVNLIIYKDEAERLNEKELSLENITVAGGHYRIQLV
ncbi:hypothetical protein ERX37_03415 [Macrococcus hajekii]|uniref:Uncharacterized protein n=1 Tax=Macrococcus hajekii TaxID=198482 RepID=A0A4R6BN83_9STAP|nr:hypothetical protein [Macrococcus hajekii]TDM03147.1 hypothetical protein ERX37_03415 [Macrococcus hajekii]GGA96341.1 hypothetical protein GCM10007190_00490 [Macrococcus hajekii]